MGERGRKNCGNNIDHKREKEEGTVSLMSNELVKGIAKNTGLGVGGVHWWSKRKIGGKRVESP